MGILKKWMNNDEDAFSNNTSVDEYYDVTPEDALNENDVVLIHDDLLATGGTMKAACALVKKFGVKKIYVNFLVELEFLKGREVFDADVEVESLIKY